MKLVSAAQTDIGKKRKHNEDAHLVDDRLGLYAVADGMGGHEAGEVASQEAVESLHDNLLSHLEVLRQFRDTPGQETGEAVRAALELSIRAAAYQVFGLSEIDPARKGMGTTISLLLLMPQVAFIGHVGDSRIYILRGGRAVLATSDHTYVAAMVAQGKMTEEEADRSKYRNVLLRAVGSHDYVEVDTRILRYRPGDVFLVCSDGLHGYLQPGELEKLVDPNDLDASIKRLIQLALDRGGKDNITGILAKADP
jgi:serine/threonine protein phosphatase PrpC